MKKIIISLIFLLLLCSFVFAEEPRTCNVVVCNYTEEDALLVIGEEGDILLFQEMFRSNSCSSTVRLPEGEYIVIAHTETGGIAEEKLIITQEQVAKCRQGDEGAGGNILVEIVMQKKEMTI